MRRPTGRIPRSRVSFTPVNFGTDEDGGRPPRTGSASAGLPCRVHPATAEDVPEHLREQGVLYFTLHLFDDPGDVRVRDRAAWLDSTPPRTLVVTGEPRSAAGEARTWLVDCEYRPGARAPRS